MKNKRLAWISAALLFLLGFIRITWELSEGSELGLLDRRALIWIATLRRPMLNGPVIEVTALGSVLVLSLVSGVVLLGLTLKNDRSGARFLTLGGLGTVFGTVVFKQVFLRPRPEVVPRLVEVGGYSFPSGHAFGASATYMILMLLAWRSYHDLGSQLLLLAVTVSIVGCVGFSRLYLGVHYPSDVLAGVMLGMGWACTLRALLGNPPVPF